MYEFSYTIIQQLRETTLTIIVQNHLFIEMVRYWAPKNRDVPSIHVHKALDCQCRFMFPILSQAEKCTFHGIPPD